MKRHNKDIKHLHCSKLLSKNRQTFPTHLLQLAMWKDCQVLPASNSVNAGRFYHLEYSSCSMKLQLVQTLRVRAPAPPLPVCLSGVHSDKFNLFYSIALSFSDQNSVCRLLQTSISVLPQNTKVKHKYKVKYNLPFPSLLFQCGWEIKYGFKLQQPISLVRSALYKCNFHPWVTMPHCIFLKKVLTIQPNTTYISSTTVFYYILQYVLAGWISHHKVDVWYTTRNIKRERPVFTVVWIKIL